MSKTELELHALPKITTRRRKRVGRGYGSGKGGHTSGRGQKGQRSRRTIPWWFEGGQLPLVRRVPFWRGKGRLNPLKQKPVIIKTGQFNILKSGSKVTIDTLIHERMVNEAEAKSRGVKILADGKLEKKVTVEGIPMSEGARREIEKPRTMLTSSRGLRPRVGRAQVRGSDVPADFSREKSGPIRKRLVSIKTKSKRRPRTSRKVKLRKTKYRK